MDTEGSDDTRLEREKVDWFLVMLFHGVLGLTLWG